MIKALYCLPVALAYQIIFNPFIVAGLLVMPYVLDAIPWWPLTTVWSGHWLAAMGIVGVHTLGCIGAVLTAKQTVSPLTGKPIRTPTGMFWFFGNAQDGLWVDWHIAGYHKGLKWLAPFMWTWWRNKWRNLPLISSLKWLHFSAAPLQVKEHVVKSVLIRFRTQGWMAELEYVTARRFGKFGPRLEQPDEWGAVSWAFRPFGRL